MTLTAICATSGILAHLAGRNDLDAAQKVLYATSYLTGGWAPVKNVLKSTLERKLDVNFLMVLAAIGAAVIGDFGEGATLLFLFSLSGALEKITLERTARSIEALIELRPDTALLIRNGTETRVKADQLQPGDRVRILPAERLPVDGVVADGQTSIDQSTITGESIPVDKKPGDEVFAGTLNQRGSIVVEVQRTANETMLAKIVRTVRAAQDQRADTERFILRWQKPYVVCVLIASFATFLFHAFFHQFDPVGATPVVHAFKQAMVLLVGASPCAVVIATPAATLAGITRAARSGVLFKGGLFLEKLAEARVVAFDKTGTITAGKPKVVDVWCGGNGGSDCNRLLQLAASVEQRSEHPLGQAVVDAARERGISLEETTEFESHVGQGAHAELGPIFIGVGKAEMLEDHRLRVPEDLRLKAAEQRAKGQTVLLVMTNTGMYGTICVADSPRPEAIEIIKRVRAMGVEEVVILTGDHAAVAEAVAKEVGADRVIADLLPEEKVTQIARLRKAHGEVVMVGDGVNDAPALAVADIGIAMGGAGTDVALETADVVLMKNDLSGVPTALWLGRRTRKAINQGLTFAFSVIGILIAGAMLNVLPLWLAVLCHEGSTVCTVFIGLSILIAKPTDK
jgi:Cd2+/Zn2+-exporting ATPase